MEEKKSVALSLLILGLLVAGVQAQMAPPACVSGEFLTAPTGFFASPNFPNSYPPHSTCTWNITVSSGYIIKVTFHAFSLEQAHPSCYLFTGTDVSNITMTNIASGDGRQPFQLCGQQIPAPVYSVGNSIEVTFASFTDQNSGFNASYTAITYESVCPNLTTINETSGVITSPYYPRSHSENQTCSWEITANKGKRVKLVIEEMFLGLRNLSCKFDYLEIQNGSYATDGAASERTCNHLVGNVSYFSFHESMRVRFVSDGVFDGGRFTATYTQVPYVSSNECSNYSLLNEGDRAKTFYNRSIAFRCDINLSGWHRFSGQAGSQMADTCVSLYHCGTDAPGWLDGRHPAVTDGVVSRQVCFNSLISCCTFSTSISVRNCGEFYVYNLERPPHCNLRYCGSGLPLANECYNYKVLNESIRARTYNGAPAVLCDHSLAGWYRFSGAAGNQMTESCVDSHGCGNFASGWLDGSHPTVTDGVLERRVCFRSGSNCCPYLTYISVRNCGNFYIYKFKQWRPFIVCNLGYCGDGVVPSTPADVLGYNTSSTSILIQWSNDTEGHQNVMILNYTITYKELPNGNPQTKVVIAPTTQATLTGLNVHTNYSITVLASNAKGHGNSSNPIIVTTDEDKPSAPPSDVRANSTGTTSILVRWGGVPVVDQNGVILGYAVTYKALPDSVPQTKLVSAPTTQATLTGLKNYTNYSITVLAFTVKGDGPASVPIVVIIDEDKPSAPPSDVRANSVGSTSIFVQWNSIPVSDQNGVILSYTVTYKALLGGSSQTVVSAPTTQTTLTSLNEFTNYRITVFASTAKGDGPASVPTYVITDEDNPSAPPSHVWVNSTSSTSIFVQWGDVPAADHNGVILNYTVTHKALPVGNQQTKVVRAPATQTTLTGLNKYTNYSITVFASTVKGNGPASVPTVIITDEDKPNAPPHNVQGNSTASTSIVVQWGSVPVADRNGVILRYTVSYRPLPGGSLQTNVVSAERNQARLTGLNEFTNYSITVFASTAKGDGPASEPTYIITDEDKPNAPPSNVQGNNKGFTSIFVQWGGVPVADQNGVVLSYTVTYKALPHGSPQTKEVSAPTTQATLTGLKNNTNYSITVLASTVKGDGMMSTPIFVVTGINVINSFFF